MVPLAYGCNREIRADSSSGRLVRRVVGSRGLRLISLGSLRGLLPEGRQPPQCAKTHRLDRAGGNDDHRALLPEPFVNHIHRPQVQRHRVVAVVLRGRRKFLGDFGLRGSQDDPALAFAAKAQGIQVESLGDLIGRLLAECEQNSRFIIAFSTYEQFVIKRDLDIDISTRYKNALRFVRRWKAEYFSEVTLKKISLDEFLQLPEVGYEVPRHLKKGQAMKWLRSILGGLEKRGDYSKLTPKQKESWENLLEYNRHDVFGLRAVVQRASQDMKR